MKPIILGLKPGEAAIYRNIGGRYNPALVETLVLLPIVTRAAGQELGAGWNLVILHHTECGIIGCYKHAPELLEKHLGVAVSELDSMAVTDSRKAVAMAVAKYRTEGDIPEGVMITGLVYDVSTGHVEVVVPPSLLRTKELGIRAVTARTGESNASIGHRGSSRDTSPKSTT